MFWLGLVLLIGSTLAQSSSPDHSGYLPVSDNPEDDGALFYAYYEVDGKGTTIDLENVPIIIWLQVRPPLILITFIHCLSETLKVNTTHQCNHPNNNTTTAGRTRLCFNVWGLL